MLKRPASSVRSTRASSLPAATRTSTFAPAAWPSGNNTCPVKLPLISCTRGNSSFKPDTSGAADVVRPEVAITVGKNGLAACKPQSPKKACPINENVPSAGSLFFSPRTTIDGRPIPLGPIPVKRTLAPIGTPWPFVTVPLRLATFA